MLDDEVQAIQNYYSGRKVDGRGMKAWQIADGDGGLRFEISKAGLDGARQGTAGRARQGTDK